jgi:hypothetical protein
MKKLTGKSAQIQVTGTKDVEVAKKLILEGDEQVASYKPQEIVAGDDSAALLDQTNSDKKNFDQKIYMFPESFNALRRELVEHWPEIWPLVAWCMGNNGPEFVSRMNAGLQMNLQFDTNKVESICLTYLNRLRKQRGLRPINL